MPVFGRVNILPGPFMNRRTPRIAGSKVNSTLALGSLIALLSIIAGGAFGMKYLEEGSVIAACEDIFKRG